MSPEPVLDYLETDRLEMRLPTVDDAAMHRRLWTERDVRVPPHRQIDSRGRPTEEDIVAMIRERLRSTTPGLLTVVRKDSGDAIGYCGVVFNGNGSPGEPELAFELLGAVHNRGYATEAGTAVIDWAGAVSYPRMWATVWDWNLPSRRVLEKLGFIDTGRVEGTSDHGRSLLTVREL